MTALFRAVTIDLNHSVVMIITVKNTFHRLNKGNNPLDPLGVTTRSERETRWIFFQDKASVFREHVSF